MEFSHRDEAGRRAVVEEGESHVVLRWDDPTRTRRKKTFRKSTLYAAQMATLRFLFKEGFVLRAPQDGAIRWMTQTWELYPHGHPFAVGSDGIWLGDTGALRCVEPGTCAQHDHALGAEIMPRSVGFGGARPVAVLDICAGIGQSKPPFRAPARGRLAYGIVVVGSDGVLPVAEIEHTPDAHIIDGISVARDGRFIGPAAGGAGLYVDDVLTQTWAVHRAQYRPPVAAISPNGQWVALLVEGGAIEIIGPRSRRVACGFKQLIELRIDDDGIGWAGALGADFWGLYRVDTSASRINEDIKAVPALDGRSVVSVRYGQVRQFSLDGQLMRGGALPWLGMAKTGRAAWLDPDTVVVRTDAHTLAEVDLTRLA